MNELLAKDASMLLIRSILGQDSLDTMGASIQHELVENKRKYVIRGCAFIAAGSVAMILSSKMSFKGEEILGAVLALAGVAQFASIVGGAAGRAQWLYSLLFVSAGLMIVEARSTIMLAVVIALAVLMTLEGLLEMYLAFRAHPVHYWGWILFLSFATLTVASLVWLSLPSLAATALGPIVALNLMLYGVLLLILVWQTKF